MKFKSIHIFIVLFLILVLYNVKKAYFTKSPLPPRKYVEHYTSPGPKTKSVSLGVNLRE